MTGFSLKLFRQSLQPSKRLDTSDDAARSQEWLSAFSITLNGVQTHGSVGTLYSFPSMRALLSAVAGSLKAVPPVPSLTSTPPDPTLTVRASALSRSAVPGGSSGSGRLAFTRSICSSFDSPSLSNCYRSSQQVSLCK